MAIEQTLSIIKPDAVAKGHVDEICKRLEDAGLNIIDKKSLHLDQEKAEGFYIEHKGKPFFADLIAFMTSGPVQVQILEGETQYLTIEKLWETLIQKRPMLVP